MLPDCTHIRHFPHKGLHRDQLLLKLCCAIGGTTQTSPTKIRAVLSIENFSRLGCASVYVLVNRIWAMLTTGSTVLIELHCVSCMYASGFVQLSLPCPTDVSPGSQL